IGSGWPVWFCAALLPVAESAERDMVADREFLLRHAKVRRIIFACGVRFIRLRSPRVSGCASRSARAAASAAAGVIGIALCVLPEVVVLLILRCSSRRNNPNAFPRSA